MKTIKYLVIGWMVIALGILLTGCETDDSLIELNNCNASTRYTVTRSELIDPAPGTNFARIVVEGHKECDTTQTIHALLVRSQGISMPIYLWFETYWQDKEYVGVGSFNYGLYDNWEVTTNP